LTGSRLIDDRRASHFGHSVINEWLHLSEGHAVRREIVLRWTL
jgi:hypothetical protein